ncbi:MAG: Flp family type IVb pilin [Anaerolineae bacterium]
MLLRSLSDRVTLVVLYIQNALVWLREEDEGASMVEYAILVALIAVVGIAAVQALGTGIATVFQNILGRIQALGR